MLSGNRNSTVRRATGAAASLFALALAGCGAESPAPVSIAAPVDAEVGRIVALHAALDPAALPEFARGAIDASAPAVERARDAASPELRLYRLRDASVYVGALDYLARSRVDVRDQEALRKLWESDAGAFTLESPRSGGPLVERALAQAARNRAVKLYRASLPYGRAQGVESGLYYLGEAHAALAYATFVESLPVDSSVEEPSPSAGAIANALTGLERELAAAFERNPTGGDAIYPSSLLKEARELAEGGMRDAAALVLMEARLAVSRATKPQAPGEPAMPQIPASAREASLTSLFASIARQRGPELAQPIVADVLPFYRKLVEPAALVARDEASVTVTLVRWPYT